MKRLLGDDDRPEEAQRPDAIRTRQSQIKKYYGLFMSLFDGMNIFGFAVSMSTTDHTRERQLNSYFGVSGLEAIDGGLRGRTTIVSGLLYANSASALAGSESLFRSYNDGVARTLIDQFGTIWSNVRLELFHPQGRVKQSSAGYYLRPYQARFLHLA
ncbi:MAG: hypothetical protein NVSMB9_15910 [Isosphaeraceae bacterium]